MPDNARVIAEGLSEAQRADVLAADASDAYCPHFGRLYQGEDTYALVDAYPAHHDPDCSTDDDGGTRWSFTPLGIEVRNFLTRTATAAGGGTTRTNKDQ